MEIIIKANKSWWNVNLREVWEYRDLLNLLIRRDFVAKYKQTVLGPLWFILQPLLQTLLFAFVFGIVARFPPKGMPVMLFYLASLMGWTLLSTNFNATASSLTSNHYIFSKVYFPRLIPPLATCVNNLLGFSVQVVIFLLFFIWYKWISPAIIELPSGWGLLMLPLFALHILVLSLGMGLWVSALSARYRDLMFALGFLTQVWMYASPVIFPMSKVPESIAPYLYYGNPVAPLLEALRLVLLGDGWFSWGAYALSLSLSFIILITGIQMFHRAERTFVDTV